MKNGWVKVFSDNSYITGADDDIDSSWKNTRLDGMVAALIYHNGYKLELIAGLGEYSQSDDYQLYEDKSFPELIKRRLQFNRDNKWETIELDIETGEIKHFMMENKI